MSKLFINLVLSLPFVGAFALFAVGIVVIYRASRVLNLAHGAMAMLPAYVVYSLSKAGLPLPIALLIGVASGAGLGMVVERVFVRALRQASLTAQTVGTVAVLSLLIALVAKIWGTASRQAPQVFPKGFVKVGSGHLQYGAIGLFVTAGALALGALALFKFTDLGLAMRGSAENRRAAALMGINPDRTTAIAWAIGGALAAVSGILLAAITILTPYDLPLQTLPAFVAALLGGIESLPGAIIGSAAVGFIYGVVPATSDLPVIKAVTGTIGGKELVLTVVALFVMARRGQRFSVATRDDGGFASAGVRARTVRRAPLPLWAMGLGVAALVGWVWLPFVSYSIMANASLAIIYAVVGISLVILTGWVGQISLGQAALVGIGAFTTGVLARNAGVEFPFNLPMAAAVSALAASLLGGVALRVRGLYLAVATLIFSWMADAFLFRNVHFVGGSSSTIPNKHFGVPGGFPDFDLSSRRVLYYFGLAVLGLAFLAAANLRGSKTGRAWFALRGSETAAASLGINVMRYKLLAFAISGMLAGAAGNLFIIDQRTVGPEQFKFTVSLLFLSIVVVGGLTSLPGVVFAGVLFAGLNELFLRVSLLSGWLEVVTAGLLVVAVLIQGHRAFITRQLDRILQPVRDGIEQRRAAPAQLVSTADVVDLRDTEAPRVERVVDVLPVVDGAIRRRDDAPLLLEGRGITVRFGGLTAVSDATIEIYQGEIVGLIGPNGAGKTTLFNALSGLNEPTHGTVRLYGRDVSRAPVHERARLGMARTFQALQLFGDMSVRENLLVATHAHDRTGFVRHLLATDAAIGAERTARRRVQEAIDLLDLHDIADRPAAGLPFGLLRLVELARAVVTGAPVILLDEPASGLDNTETERFAAFLRELRDRTGVTMLLIEHDVKMVTGVSDYMYVLNMGQLIAEGSPEQVQRDPHVIAAYLGQPDAAESTPPVATGPVAIAGA
jgi:ABC-type branched-subunit amino acid transport system ATPase component/ABC-type branched-subunit amino acid transport system permease subunit